MRSVREEPELSRPRIDAKSKRHLLYTRKDEVRFGSFANNDSGIGHYIRSDVLLCVCVSLYVQVP